jgi:hypothetical protein
MEPIILKMPLKLPMVNLDSKKKPMFFMIFIYLSKRVQSTQWWELLVKEKLP